MAEAPGNGSLERIRQLEDWRRAKGQERIVERIPERVAVLEEQAKDISELRDEVRGLRRNIVLFSLSFIGIAFTILIGVVAVIVEIG